MATAAADESAITVTNPATYHVIVHSLRGNAAAPTRAEGAATTAATRTISRASARPPENRAAAVAVEAAAGAATTVAIPDIYPEIAPSPENNKVVMAAAVAAGNKRIVQQRHLHAMALT